jgi:hypothetical protein
VPGRVGVHLVALVAIQIRSCLEQSGAEGDRLFVRSLWVFDVQVEMHLLRAAVRPVRGDMVRRQLHADPPLSGGIDDAVPRLVGEDVPAEKPGPERALGT